MTIDAGVPDVAAPATSEPADSAPTGAAPEADPRAVRAGVAPTTRADGDPTIVISPLATPVLRPIERLAGNGILGGTPSAPVRSHLLGSAGATDGEGPSAPTARAILVNGEPLGVQLETLDSEHAILVEAGAPGAAGPTRTRVMLGAARRRDSDGAALREVVIDGWRVDIELESERRAALRERARRGHETAGKGGPIEVRAIIPGRIVAVSVGKGDDVAAGQQVLVLEAMKMQNELRAPREGRVERIPVAVGDNVEIGDLLMVIT
jgi:biotin carboxyl carrier protein